MEKILLLGFADAGQAADKQLLEAAAAVSIHAGDDEKRGKING